MGKEAYFWIFSGSVVLVSFFISEIDTLVNQLFGGYLGFINNSLIFGNPIFVLIIIGLLAMLLGKKYMSIYIELFVNASLLWIEIFPALYLYQFYEIKLIIIGFCLINIALSWKCVTYIRKNIKKLKQLSI